jgi:cytoskeletal protein RodZ
MPPRPSTASPIRAAEPQAPASAGGDRRSDAAAFGASLREQREARHLTLEQIAAVTKIASRHFNELERGDIRRWPGGMYRRAMIRAYARAVGLDAEDTVRTFLEVFPDEHGTVAVAPQKAPEHDARGTAIVRDMASTAGIIGAAAAIFLVAWYAASYISSAIESDAVSTSQSVSANANEPVDTAQPAPLDQVAAASLSEATSGISDDASSGTTDEPVREVAIPTEGELRVVSDPDGAQVTVNGVGWGRTPVTIKYLPMGEKRVRFTKDGYASAERSIDITAERPLRSLNVTLQPRTSN